MLPMDDAESYRGGIRMQEALAFSGIGIEVSSIALSQGTDRSGFVSLTAGAPAAAARPPTFRLHSVNRPESSSETDAEGNAAESNGRQALLGRRSPLAGFIGSSRSVFRADDLGKEIVGVALPALLGLAVDPLASLVDTAFIGQLGSTEIAGVGVAISVFNLISKILNIPLLNITTSYVAEDNASKVQTTGVSRSGGRVKATLPAASSSLILGSGLGLLQAGVLLVASEPILKVMGILPGSPMLLPAKRYLSLRALGAPAVVVSIALQGVFRGFKNTTTPLYAIVFGNVVHILLDPIFMFSLGYGVGGAAVATVLSEYLSALVLLWKLNELVSVVPPSFDGLGFDRFFKSGGLLFLKTMAILLTFTFATSRAAQQSIPQMAAHQICMQIWLAASLLSDSLALAGQAIVADSLAKGDTERARHAAFRVLQQGVAFGLGMLAILAVGEEHFSRLFTNDSQVMEAMSTIILFVVGTQPINSVAFVFDGVLYGASDFAYVAYSMVLIGILSSIILLIASFALGLSGIWIGLTLLMTFRMLSGFLRLGTASGPWHFLAEEPLEDLET